MSNYKATPGQWEEVGAFVSATRDCILELRARVEALEAQAGSREVADPAPVATDEDLRDIMRRRGTSWIEDVRAIYNLTKAGQLEDAQILRHAAAMLMERSEQEAGR